MATPVPPDQRVVLMTVSLHPQMKEDIDALSKELVMPRSELVRRLLQISLTSLGRPSFIVDDWKD